MVKPKLSRHTPTPRPWGTSVASASLAGRGHAEVLRKEPPRLHGRGNPRRAGKTTFALTLAKELFNRGTVRQLIVVAPTDHLKKQWADAAAKCRYSD